MADTKLDMARKIVKEKPHLVWGTKNYKTLSSESIFEAIISFGDWDDFLKAKEIFGTAESHSIYKKITSKKRTNIRPSTKSFFDNYFAKHA